MTAASGVTITLEGTLTLSASGYELRTSHRNKVNGMPFDNAACGTCVRDGRTITLLYGDEGTGSNQTRGVFRRDGYAGCPARASSHPAQ